jgi:hypothetical protein
VSRGNYLLLGHVVKEQPEKARAENSPVFVFLLFHCEDEATSQTLSHFGLTTNCIFIQSVVGRVLQPNFRKFLLRKKIESILNTLQRTQQAKR